MSVEIYRNETVYLSICLLHQHFIIIECETFTSNIAPPVNKVNNMAKAKEKESLSAYFRRHFEAHPDWLEAGTNAAVIERWQNDHAGEERTKKIDQTLANVKSQLRKKHGMIRHRKRKRGRPPGSGAGAEVKRARTPVSILERLEGMIDQCLSF